MILLAQMLKTKKTFNLIKYKKFKKNQSDIF